MQQRRLTVALAILVVGSLTTWVAPAQADNKTVKQIERMNREAMENYDLLDYEAAKKELNEALALAKRKRLTKHAVAAQTHLYLGIVEFSGFTDKESALLQFMDAVDADPKIQIPVAYRTSELSELLDGARSELGAGGKTAPAAAARPPAEEAPATDELAVDCKALVGMQHDIVDEAPAGADRAMTAYVAAGVHAAHVGLHYRPQGKDSFIEVPMKKVGACRYVGVIPADAIAGDFLHYYIAAINKADKTVASKGSAGSPNIMEITTGRSGGGAGGSAAADVDDENPLGGGGRPRTSGGGVISGGVRGGVEVGGDAPTFFVTLAFGSGGGYVTGKTESIGEDIGCCFAPALFHVFPEIGYMLNRRSSLSLAVRIGFPVGANVAGHSTGAPGGLLRYRRAFAEDGEGLAMTVGIGGGVLRNTVKLTDAAMQSKGLPPDQDTDTVALGPLLVSGGLAYVATIGGPMRFVAEANAIAGVPVVSEIGDCSSTNGSCVKPQLGVQMDVNLGVMFAF